MWNVILTCGDIWYWQPTGFDFNFFYFLLTTVLRPDGPFLSVLPERKQRSRRGIFNSRRIGSRKSPGTLRTPQQSEQCSKAVWFSWNGPDGRLSFLNMPSLDNTPMKTCEEPDITKFFDDSRGMQGGFSQMLPLRELKIPLARTLHTFGRRRKYEPARLERSSK